MKVGILHTAFLGDLALAGLLIEGLHQSGHEIVLITNRGGTAIYQDDLRVSSIMTIAKGRGVTKFKTVGHIADMIRSLKLDVLMVPHKSPTSALISLLSAVPKRIGFDKASLSRVAYSERRPWKKFRHESLRCLDLAPSWLIGDEVRKRLEALERPVLSGKAPLIKFGENCGGLLQSKRPFFIVAPGSVWKTKIYPPEKLAEAAFQLMQSRPDLFCVVSGGPQDEQEIAKFLSRCKTLFSLREGDQLVYENNIIDASQCLPIPELISLSRKAAFVIANDSAPLHVAAGTNTPVIGIFGPTPADTGFGPSGRHALVKFHDNDDRPLPCQPCSPHGANECPKGHHLCMKGIPPAQVAAAVESLLPDFFAKEP